MMKQLGGKRGRMPSLPVSARTGIVPTLSANNPES